jgi:EAL domain-containing protein (putative c-di-GMP-specific phosphodiesterase class I)
MTNNELVVLYQPQFCPSTRELFGIEALVRWNHPTHGMILPERFIRIAEESGLIHDLDEWVMRTALFQVREWQNQDLIIPRIAINVSARELLHDHLDGRISHALNDSKIDTDKVKIEIEITESVLQRSNSSMNMLSNLRQNGIRVSIDDFGTGYSSLSQLKRMPIDSVKIDRSFLHDLEYNDESKAIITAIISMGHSLGLQVIAEGIENEYQLNFLNSHACDAVQGFLMSRPLDAKTVRKYLIAE